MGLASRAARAHRQRVEADIAPRLRTGETYRYRSLCYLVSVDGWSRAYRVYAYLTDQRVIFIEDSRTAPQLGSHDLIALRDVAYVEDKFLALTFAEPDSSATVAGLEFTPARIREEWTLQLTALSKMHLDATTARTAERHGTPPLGKSRRRAR